MGQVCSIYSQNIMHGRSISSLKNDPVYFFYRLCFAWSDILKNWVIFSKVAWLFEGSACFHWHQINKIHTKNKGCYPEEFKFNYFTNMSLNIFHNEDMKWKASCSCCHVFTKDRYHHTLNNLFSTSNLRSSLQILCLKFFVANRKGNVIAFIKPLKTQKFGSENKQIHILYFNTR